MAWTASLIALCAVDNSDQQTNLMKSKIYLAFLAISSLTSSTSAHLISDNFNNGIIDTSAWQIITPFGDSSITESGGDAVLANKGWLLSASLLPTALDITGRFQFTGSVHDQFKVVTRASGTFADNPFGEVDLGIGFEFWMMTDSGSPVNNLKIVRNTNPGSTPILSEGTFAISLNTYYDFRLTDDGTSLALYISDLSTPFLTATESSVLGSRLAIYNREGTGGGSSISDGSIVRLDYVQVVPEPSSALLLFAGAAVWLCRRKLGIKK